MLRRDSLLIVGTASISSLLTYFTCSVTTPPEAPRSTTSASAEPQVAPPDIVSFETAVPEESKSEPGCEVASRQQAAKPDSDDRSEIRSANDPVLALQKRQELGERFSSLIDNAGHPDSSLVSAKVENRFYAEEWNQEWAGDQERSIRNLVGMNEDLRGVTPPQVTCRSKNCQVIFSASSQEQVQRVTEMFMQAATRGDASKKDRVVSFFPDSSMKRVVFYLSDEGNMDLFQ
jgi:hypothetical protein